jgi:hypothetical protein
MRKDSSGSPHGARFSSLRVAHIGVDPLFDGVILADFGRGVVASILGVVGGGTGGGSARTASFAGGGAGVPVSTGGGATAGGAAISGGLATATSVGGTGPEGGAGARSWLQAVATAATTRAEKARRLRFIAGTSSGQAGV